VRSQLAGLPQPDSSIHKTGVGKGERALEQRRANQVALLQHWGFLPSSRLLEIGCGVGWLAYDLAFLLDDTGSYAGFDVSRKAVRWLTENFAPRLPNFRFDAVDVLNARYRPKGQSRPESFRFPYADDEFDLVCAFGVFMHMSLPGVDNYLREVARVLQPGKRALLTFMAITEADNDPRNAHRPYVDVSDGVYTNRPDRVDWSLAYDDVLIRNHIADAGLVLQAVEEGSWHRRRPPIGKIPVPGADLYVVAAT
jgi:SAM-dependent methyltransferase